jgi:hypothetical protein
MLRVDKTGKSLHRLQPRKLAEAGFLERSDVQQMIRHNPEDFFNELGEKLLLIGEEVEPTDFVADRIDLLAVGSEGDAVVIELKRGTHKLQLLQALGYAGMISKWPAERFIDVYSKLGANGDPREQLEQCLESEDASTLNQSQRIILLAEDFDFEVLVTAEWLTEKYDVDIRCYRLALSSEAGSDFLTCTCIYPPPEITEHAIQRKRGALSSTTLWPDWETALRETENEAVAKFFRKQLAANRESDLKYRRLLWRFNGKRRFRVMARRSYAIVKQYGRFPDDVKFWADKMGNDIKLREPDHAENLRFLLQTEEQFQKLPEAIESLKTMSFAQPTSGQGEDVESDE